MRRLAVALALVAAVLAPMVSRPELALACSLAPIDPGDRVERFSEGSEAIVVGEVAEEREEPLPGSTPQYESRVRVVAVLAGDPPAEVRLAGLGQLGADCSGGPRLVEGERVLLFLTQRDALGRATDRWRVTGFQGKYGFDQGAAYMLTTFVDRVPAGTAAGLLAEVAAVNASDPAEVDRALAFAEGRDDRGEEVVMAQSDDDRERGTSMVGPLAMIAGLAVAGAAMAAAAWRALRRRPR